MNKRFSLGSVLDIAVYGILAAIMAVLQTTLMHRIPVYGAIADIVIGAVCCIGIYRGENTAAAFGLFAGLCVDALGTTGVSLLPLFYTLTGYVCGRIGTNAREGARFTANLITVPFLCLARTLFSLLNHIINYFGDIDFGILFLYILLPELIYTAVVCIPVFIIVKFFEIPVIIARKRGGLY